MGRPPRGRRMFELHPRLAADCHALARRGRLHYLLQRNASLPWFLIVPESTALELCDLPGELRTELVAATDALARYVKRRFACDRINVAAIGNLVPQLHVHVVGRRRDDCCWPHVVWGRELPPCEHPPQRLAELRAALSGEV